MPTSIAHCRCGKTKRLRGHRRHFTCPECLAERAKEREATPAGPVLLPHPELLNVRYRRLAGGAGPATLAYRGSDSALTRRTLRALEARGQPGRIAAALFRCQKASSRAKVYRGGPDGSQASYTELAYRNKGAALQALSRLLAEDGTGLAWGWGTDGTTDFAPHVLYVETPKGQVSFHSTERFSGPAYGGAWDGIVDASVNRILAWCDALLSVPVETTTTQETSS
jgi:hypothetical protein